MINIETFLNVLFGNKVGSLKILLQTGKVTRQHLEVARAELMMGLAAVIYDVKNRRIKPTLKVGASQLQEVFDVADGVDFTQPKPYVIKLYDVYSRITDEYIPEETFTGF